MSIEPVTGTGAARAAANRAALARLHAVRPQWRAVVSARDAIALPDFTLLHAGPPFADPVGPPPPVLSSAVLACLHEGWASTETDAQRLIASGKVRLADAQSYRVVVPLAAIVSPNTPLVEVIDAAAPDDPRRRAWSMFGSGAGAQIRFGTRDPAVLERLRWRDTVFVPLLAHALAGNPVDLLPLAAAGLVGDDDLHARTTAATAALADRLALPAARGILDQSPLFFLTLWMAACHLMMDAAANGGSDPDATLVVALAGNGREVGVRLAGDPSRWVTQPAAAPRGPRIRPGSREIASPLVGDSGVIDAAGFGAQALRLAPEPAEAFASWLPGDWQTAQPPLFAGDWPEFGGLRCALDAAAVAERGTDPLAAIAMIDSAGRAGLLGRGVYAAPLALFLAALNRR
ncbi:oxamate carbamoyltransferase subunit AllG family protein [Caballeronia sp. DA-9]|uniref:oxamate carbamoyltransferase subunit AllG family protein n=1 Tax=Caballeronia sp. DA-9 TaxID=3436237 RepID=UPI003F670B73